MHDYKHRRAITIAAFGVFGLIFYLLVAGISALSHVRNGDIPLLYRGSYIRMAGDRQAFGGSMVGRSGCDYYYSIANVCQGRHNQEHTWADIALKEIEE